MCRAGSEGEVDVGHHALVQQQEIGRHAAAVGHDLAELAVADGRDTRDPADRHLRLHLA
jgi:hypothetical protein